MNNRYFSSENIEGAMNVIYEAENPELEQSDNESKPNKTENPKQSEEMNLPKISQSAPKHIQNKINRNPQLLIDIKFREH